MASNYLPQIGRGLKFRFKYVTWVETMVNSTTVRNALDFIAKLRAAVEYVNNELQRFQRETSILQKMVFRSALSEIEAEELEAFLCFGTEEDIAIYDRIDLIRG